MKTLTGICMSRAEWGQTADLAMRATAFSISVMGLWATKALVCAQGSLDSRRSQITMWYGHLVKSLPKAHMHPLTGSYPGHRASFDRGSESDWVQGSR